MMSATDIILILAIWLALIFLYTAIFNRKPESSTLWLALYSLAKRKKYELTLDELKADIARQYRIAEEPMPSNEELAVMLQEFEKLKFITIDGEKVTLSKESFPDLEELNRELKALSPRNIMKNALIKDGKTEDEANEIVKKYFQELHRKALFERQQVQSSAYHLATVVNAFVFGYVMMVIGYFFHYSVFALIGLRYAYQPSVAMMLSVPMLSAMYIYSVINR
jgi:hypothetical protein